MSEQQKLNCIKQVIEKHRKLQNKHSLSSNPELTKDLKACHEFNISKNVLFERNVERRITAIKHHLKIQEQKFIKKQNNVSLFKKIKSYILAELTTIIQGQINKKEYEQRRSACLDCHGRVDSIEGKTDPGGIGFCSLCGCGASKRAALSVKLTIGGASCPLNKWEPLKGTEWSFKVALQAIFGLFTSAYYHIFNKIIGNMWNKKSI